ncbi:MAG: hypothetical protein AAB455_02005 [Patescibacteria group bacterium]
MNFCLVALIAFGLGRLSRLEEAREPVRIENVATPALVSSKITTSTTSISAQTSSQAGQFVGSKNGTKYHYPWCSGAQRIKEENKVWFASKEEAATKGYTPASNCPGL